MSQEEWKEWTPRCAIHWNNEGPWSLKTFHKSKEVKCEKCCVSVCMQSIRQPWTYRLACRSTVISGFSETPTARVLRSVYSCHACLTACCRRERRSAADNFTNRQPTGLSWPDWPAVVDGWWGDSGHTRSNDGLRAANLLTSMQIAYDTKWRFNRQNLVQC